MAGEKIQREPSLRHLIIMKKLYLIHYHKILF